MILAMVVFSTTSGISLNVHFCKGKVKTFAFFTEAEACSKDAPTTEEPTDHVSGKCHNKSALSRIQCCLDKSFFYKLSAESSNGIASVSIPDFSFLALNTYSSRPVVPNSGRDTIYSINDPPFIDISIAVLHQVFRI